MAKKIQNYLSTTPGTTIPETLFNRLHAKLVIPFVGAGVSMAIQRRASKDRLYPSWKELLAKAAERLMVEKKNAHANVVKNLLLLGEPEHYLAAATHAFEGLGASWYDFLREQLDYRRDEADDESLELARQIWCLGSPIIVTTNYDRVLHWACPQRDDLAIWDIEAPAEQAALLRGENSRPVVWHLHGHVGNLAKIILTPDGYNRLYIHDIPSDSPYEAALDTLRYQLSTHSFLFIGFSFNDTHFSSQLRQLEHIYRGASGPHYVLLHKDEAEFVRRAGHPRIELVTYDDYGPPLLEKLRELTAIAEGHYTKSQSQPAISTTVKSPKTVATVRVPPFHYGSVVPLDHFIDRESELKDAEELIAVRQSFLIVGHRRAGKTSFGQKLIHTVMSNPRTGNKRILGSYLDLQRYSKLDVNRFLAYTLLNLIGEVARQVFACKYTTLSRRNPFELHPELQQDNIFAELLELYRQVVERTHTRGESPPSELTSGEFEYFIADLVEIIRHKGWYDIFIFYDEANRLPVDLEVDFLRWNVEALNRAGITSIYSASPELVEQFNPWTGREIRIGPFLNVEDMLHLLARYYFGETSLREDLPVAREAIVRIWELSRAVPYLIQHLSGQSFSLANKDKARQVEERHVLSAHEQLIQERPSMFRDGPGPDWRVP